MVNPFGIPLKNTRVTCEVARKVNSDIVMTGIHPEDKSLEAAVITHTLLCVSCNKYFLALDPEKSTPED
mgnify:CR=1 FL=1|jgi:hypothetical protein